MDEDIKREIEQFNSNPDTFKGLKEIDGEVQLLTDIASSIGLCLATDFHLIRVYIYFAMAVFFSVLIRIATQWYIKYDLMLYVNLFCCFISLL